MNFILITVLCVLVHSTYGQNCEKCMTTNDASCVNDRDYYLCIGGKPTTTLYTCEDGYICTASENICEPKIQADGTETVAACSASTSCNICPDENADNKRYTCVGKSHFARCANGKITTTAPCEGNTVCNSKLYAGTGKICAPPCVIEFFEYSNTCSNDDITTTTTIGPSTTPNPQNLKDQCNRAQITNQKYFYISNENDVDCVTYIFCELFGGEMEALLIKCSNGYYFDSTISQCVDTKPQNCGVTTTTTAATTTTAGVITTTAAATTTTVAATTTTAAATTTAAPTTTTAAATTTTAAATTTTAAATTSTAAATTTTAAATTTTVPESTTTVAPTTINN